MTRQREIPDVSLSEDLPTIVPVSPSPEEMVVREVAQNVVFAQEAADQRAYVAILKQLQESGRFKKAAKAVDKLWPPKRVERFTTQERLSKLMENQMVLAEIERAERMAADLEERLTGKGGDLTAVRSLSPRLDVLLKLRETTKGANGKPLVMSDLVIAKTILEAQSLPVPRTRWQKWFDVVKQKLYGTKEKN